MPIQMHYTLARPYPISYFGLVELEEKQMKRKKQKNRKKNIKHRKKKNGKRSILERI